VAVVYAVVDPDGGVASIENTVGEAVSAAGDVSEDGTVSVEQDDQAESGGALGDLGIAPADWPEDALRRSGLKPIDWDAVMRIPLEDAHARLRPFFDPGIKAYRTPKGLAKTLLGQNYKTAKETPEKPSDVQGLNLLPHELGIHAPRLLGGKSAGGIATTNLLPAVNASWCVGSNRFCRSACLAHTGRNVYGYSIRVKRQRCAALVAHPEAFMRAVAERVAQHERNSTKRGDEPFVRMNVLSDIPWELVAPGLFQAYPNLQFYDYTKVPGRDPRAAGVENYDLTFSYSGSNWTHVRHEVTKSRRRVAIVFLPKRKYQAKEIREQPMIGLPSRFQGLDVVEGDFSDVRPRDPPTRGHPKPAFVGLRWKIPRGAERRAMKTSAFVVPVHEVDGQLIAGLAAKDQPIEDSDAEEPDALSTDE